MRLENKVAVITGAGQGIGQAIAARFAREGARLVINDINTRTGQATLRRLRQLCRGAALVSGDVSRLRVARQLMARAREGFGRIDILVNNAGIAGSAFGDGPVTALREQAWDKILRVNLKSVFCCCRFAIPEMVRDGGGSIINIASVLALVGCREHFTSHAYVASKGGMISLTRAMAAYYAAQGVRVNAVCPGLIRTPMTKRAQGDPRVLRFVAERQPLLSDLGMPEDVAAAAVFLASDESRMVTGVVLPVDAGWSSSV